MTRGFRDRFLERSRKTRFWSVYDVTFIESTTKGRNRDQGGLAKNSRVAGGAGGAGGGAGGAVGSAGGAAGGAGGAGDDSKMPAGKMLFEDIRLKA